MFIRLNFKVIIFSCQTIFLDIVKHLDFLFKVLYYFGMETNKSFEKLMEDFVQIVNKYNDLNSIPYNYGTGILLHPSEIHALNAIQSENKPNITDLSTKLGVTKSAASQVVQKLVQKELVEKFKASGNAKDVLIRLTEPGIMALQGFQQIRGDIFRELLNEFNSLNQSQIDLVGLLFKRIGNHFDRIIKDRQT